MSAVLKKIVPSGGIIRVLNTVRVTRFEKKERKKERKLLEKLFILPRVLLFAE